MKDIELSFWVSRKDIAFFTKNFSVMLGAGLTVVEALSIAEEQSRGKLKRMLRSMIQFVEQGNGLAEAVAQHHRQFPGIYSDVIRTGELSGTLSRNLNQLAARLADDIELRRKVRGAMIYPMVIMVGLVALGTVLSVFVFPRFIKLFKSLDVPLPTMTKIVLGVAQWMNQYWGWLLLGLAVALVAIRLLSRIPLFERLWHRVLLHLPIVGPIIQAVNLARFTGTLGSLLKSGVPITEALHSVTHSCTNLLYQRSISQAVQSIEHGDTLSSVVHRYPNLYPPLVTRMIGVGERTGQLADLLLYLGNYYNGEVDSSTKQLGILIEPLLLIAIGLVVIVVGLSVITPIYQFTAAVGQL